MKKLFAFGIGFVGAAMLSVLADAKMLRMNIFIT